jgi:chemotaxis response regulator CheB
VIRVLLADDQALVRAGYRALLDAQDGIEVVGEAADGEEALRLARALRHPVVLVAIRMPGLGMGTAAAPQALRNVFRREGEYWTVCYEGSVVRLKDSKGLRHLARLLAHPGREFHAVDLEAVDSGGASPGQGERAHSGELAVRPDLGDAGALLDASAKAAYKARLEELRAELEEAEGCNDAALAAKARQEMEFLVGELARAVGLGGRDRRAASHAERARLNATRAIRAAMANLARDNPALGRHLAATVRTGRYCAYTPDPRAPIAWER